MTSAEPNARSEVAGCGTQSTMSKPLQALFYSLVRLVMRPHMHAISLSKVSQIYGILQLTSSICHMLKPSSNNGTLTWQWEYHADMLPLSFHFLNVWKNFNLVISPFKDFYDTDYISIHCKPVGEGRAA